MEVIHVKIDEKTKEKLDHIIGRGAYRNKSEAVRSMLEEHITEHPELLTGFDIKQLSEYKDSMSDQEFRKRLARGLKGRKSVAQMLADQERDRF